MTWKDEGKPAKEFINVPPGTYAATCIDVVDLGVPDWSKNANSPDGDEMVRIVFHVRVEDRQGNPVEHPEGQAWTCSQMFRKYFGPKSFLRAFVEGMVGELTKEQAREFDEETLIGTDCLVMVKHKQSKNGKVYANVDATMRMLPGMKGPGPIPDYVRVKDRPAKQQYRKPAAKADDEEGIGF